MPKGSMRIKRDRLFTASESIDTMIASIEKINSKIETDFREIYEISFRIDQQECEKRSDSGQSLWLDHFCTFIAAHV